MNQPPFCVAVVQSSLGGTFGCYWILLISFAPLIYFHAWELHQTVSSTFTLSFSTF